MANGNGGIGILANVSQCRFSDCYLDWNDMVFADPTLVSFTGGIFLCGAHVRLVAPASGAAHGVFLSNNEFIGGYCKMGNPAVEAQGSFSSASDVTILGTLADELYQARSTSATLIAKSVTPTTTFSADFSKLLLFDPAAVPIASVSYSLTLDASVRGVTAHAARPPVGGIVTIETADAVTGSVSITVDQSTRGGGPGTAATAAAELPPLRIAVPSGGQDPNPNCESRGQCIPTFPKYPDQHTLCLAANDTQWHCAALAGVWGDAE